MSPAPPTPFTVGIPVYNEEAILVPNTARLSSLPDTLGSDHQVLQLQPGARGAARVRPPRPPLADGTEAMSAERGAAAGGAA